MELGNAIGRPIKVDETTLRREIGYYASVLVEMDLLKPKPSNVWVETKYGGFLQEIRIPKLPKFYNHCNVVGHLVAECRSKRNEVDKGENVNGVQKKNVWQVKSKRVVKQMKEIFDICNTPKRREQPIEKDVVSEDEIVDAIIPPIIQYVESTSEGNKSNSDVSSSSSSTTQVVKVVGEGEVRISEVIKKVTIFWNFRGLRRAKAKDKLGSLVNQFSPTLCFVVEPKIKWNSKDSKQLKLKGMNHMVIHNSVNRGKGNIWLFRSASITTPTIVSITKQKISLMNLPWLVIGYFNTVLSTEEKKGGRSPFGVEMQDFHNCINTCSLIQAPTTGLHFTWCNNIAGNKRIVCTLDKALYNLKWMDTYPDWSYKVGVREVSDHSPLLGSCMDVNKPKIIPFRVLKVWLEESSFKEVIKEAWDENVHGNHAYVFMNKMKIMKKKIQDWNWNVFGDVRLKLQEA
ncbi:uncharacterized protein LOC113305452 [Papaver somniferum]|uniref:uncharacterized protein LOC113305452 n=1 Tax=Papaver somniferum TaxID=3469 RepID=UPI000E70135C|nr:uncharacterized protein LOC113305452 [Papaver somniferum]